MNLIKKLLGAVWIALALFAAYYVTSKLVIPNLSHDDKTKVIAGSIYLFLVPIISLSLFIFGVYALQNEYEKES